MKNIIYFSLILVGFSCTKDKTITPYELDIPSHFPEMVIPDDNPMSYEGIALGKALFYDTRLSLDHSISCASCHGQETAFSDPNQFSKGVNNTLGDRNSMAIVNLGWQNFFFWDGRAKTLEEQILGPVPNPVEMHLEWDDAVKRIEENKKYREQFKQVFGAKKVTKELVAKAIAQFLRTLISSESKFDVMYKDRYSMPMDAEEQALFATVTQEELNGYDLFMRIDGADCFHCHNGPLMQIQKYSNNGLDENPLDKGRENVTGSINDRGKFKIPTLRNIELTAPYMHDGRFKTLEEVIEHYSSGIKISSTLDPLIELAHEGGVQLSTQEKQELLAFLKTLTDYKFINNPAFKK